MRTMEPPVLAKTELSTVIYPEDDGLPMAQNTKQYDEIVMIKGNLDILFADDPNVFIAGDLLWYPVEGNNTIRQAPDVMVAFGRPKGDRGSYLQWEEANIAPQIAFEIYSPGNRKREMDDKLIFYERYGIEEYYLYDPDRGRLQGWLRDSNNKLSPIARMIGWQSPRMEITFGLSGRALQLKHPDGSPFLTFLELANLREAAEDRALAEMLARADVEEALVEAEHNVERAEQERNNAEQAKLAAEQERDDAKSRAQAAERRAQELEEKLRQAGLL